MKETLALQVGDTSCPSSRARQQTIHAHHHIAYLRVFPLPVDLRNGGGHGSYIIPRACKTEWTILWALRLCREYRQHISEGKLLPQ